MARAALAITVMTALCATPRAAADDRHEPVSLAWSRAADANACLDRAAIVDRVRARLGFDPFVSEGAVRTLEGWVAREGEELVATWVLRDAEGEVRGQRTVRSRELDCEALSGAAVLAAALAIDPDAALREPTPAPVPTPPPEAAPAPPTPEPPAETTASPVAGFVALAAGALWGPVPSIAPSVGLRGALRSGAWAIEARAFWSFEQAASESAYAAAAVALAGSYALIDDASFRWELAAGFVGGLTFARTVDEATIPLASGPFGWAGPFAGTRAELAVDAFRLGVAVDVIVPLPRREYAVAGSDRVLFVSEPVAIGTTLELGAEVP